jgi:hypothetical protein
MQKLADKMYQSRDLDRLDITLFGHQDATAYRIAVNPRRMVEEQDFTWNQAMAYALEYVKHLSSNMPLSAGFVISNNFDEKEKCWNLTVKLPPPVQQPLRNFSLSSQWLNHPNTAMIDAFEDGHKAAVTKMATVDPETFRGSTTERVPMSAGANIPTR